MRLVGQHRKAPRITDLGRGKPVTRDVSTSAVDYRQLRYCMIRMAVKFLFRFQKSYYVCQSFTQAVCRSTHSFSPCCHNFVSDGQFMRHFSSRSQRCQVPRVPVRLREPKCSGRDIVVSTLHFRDLAASRVIMILGSCHTMNSKNTLIHRRILLTRSLLYYG